MISRALLLAAVFAAIFVGVDAVVKENTPQTTRLWEIIRNGDEAALASWLKADPTLVDLRAADGRGALHWAYEFSRMNLVKMLTDAGADEDDRDELGNTPAMLLGKGRPPVYTPPPEDEEEEEDHDEEEEDDEDDREL
jgi:hypothetical protein